MLENTRFISRFEHDILTKYETVLHHCMAIVNAGHSVAKPARLFTPAMLIF